MRIIAKDYRGTDDPVAHRTFMEKLSRIEKAAETQPEAFLKCVCYVSIRGIRGQGAVLRA